MRHKPSKDHIIPNILSRLASYNTSLLRRDIKDDKEGEQDILFTTLLIEIKLEFLDKIVKG